MNPCYFLSKAVICGLCAANLSNISIMVISLSFTSNSRTMSLKTLCARRDIFMDLLFSGIGYFVSSNAPIFGRR